jgi:2-isopropylmalate synthase
MRIADRTLCKENCTFSFKEKIEICRQLEKLKVDIIELPAIENPKTDILFVRTASSFVGSCMLSVGVGMTAESFEGAVQAISAAKQARLRVEVPVSPVGMEYAAHKKPPKMLEWVSATVGKAKSVCSDVEFCAVDATRAEPAFLNAVLAAAVEAGATSVTVCDSTGEKMPDEFASFVKNVAEMIRVPVGVSCDDQNAMAAAAAILAVRAGADTVKTAVDGACVSLEAFCGIIRNCGNHYGFAARIQITEYHRVVRQISRIVAGKGVDRSVSVNIASPAEVGFTLDAQDDQSAVAAAVAKLGYDLSDEDMDAVYNEFIRVAAKKTVGSKELEAIVSGVAMQVPPTYTLVSYMVNSSGGNALAASAQIVLDKKGEQLQGICMGDGPIDAAFVALEQIMGCHFELDDFQIQAVTEGKEAMGSALVKLRAEGKLYAGTGISTDIIGASIRAYLNAVNKIVFEQNV